jgi:hypothetical protein
LSDVLRPLSGKLAEEVLRHPATRADGPLLSKLQELLAAAPKPDVGMLRECCEQLSDGANDDAVRAMQEGRRALALRDVTAYISRGTKGVGLRAYEDTHPFVLIGGQHLVPGPFHMTRAELQFALGSELAHLTFGHSRVTSSDVWAGALSKSKQGLDVALSIIPVLQGWALADRAARVTSRVPLPIIRRFFSGLGGARSRVWGNKPSVQADHSSELSTLNENLIAAHRVMQLTADRAGLLLAQDVRSAVRGMLLVRRDYQAEWASIEKQGLARVLGRRTEDGNMAYQNLAVRISAMFSFYLSDDYMRLRSALYE